MTKFRQSASSIEQVKKSIEYAKMLDRAEYQKNMQKKIVAWCKLIVIGAVCLLLSLLF